MSKILSVNFFRHCFGTLVMQWRTPDHQISTLLLKRLDVVVSDLSVLCPESERNFRRRFAEEIIFAGEFGFSN